jgi:glycosyltransferase involved in cell wall biosynthesis
MIPPVSVPGKFEWSALGPDALPSVTVVVPSKDRPELLERCLRSILNQRYSGSIECIVVFDGSTSQLPSGIAGQGRSLQAVSNVRSPGLAGTRNSGALLAKGSFLAFCDDDDEWLPDKLSAQVAALVDNPASLVATCGVFVQYGRRTFRRVPPGTRVTLRHLLRSRMMEVHPSTLVVRTSDFLETIGLVDESLPGSYAEDYEWLLRAARRAPILAVRQPLARIYWHPGSWFASGWDAMAAALTHLLERYPEFGKEPRGTARIMGQIAFAHAASGRGAGSRAWARRSLKLNPFERRAYLALLVSLRMLRAETVLHAAHLVGKGI